MEINITKSFEAVLVMKGMAYYSGEGVFTLNRKGRRFLESQAGKKATDALRARARILQGGRETHTEVKKAWADKKPLAPAEK